MRIFSQALALMPPASGVALGFRPHLINVWTTGAQRDRPSVIWPPVSEAGGEKLIWRKRTLRRSRRAHQSRSRPGIGASDIDAVNARYAIAVKPGKWRRRSTGAIRMNRSGRSSIPMGAPWRTRLRSLPDSIWRRSPPQPGAGHVHRYPDRALLKGVTLPGLLRFWLFFIFFFFFFFFIFYFFFIFFFFFCFCGFFFFFYFKNKKIKKNIIRRRERRAPDGGTCRARARSRRSPICAITLKSGR